MSGVGVEGPGHATGSHLKGFDLTTGEGKISAQFPGKTNLCNDMTVASDGTVYVTNSLTPQILQLKPGAKDLEVWVENKQFQPPTGVGLDGIAIGGDGNIYVNTFNGGDFFRIEVRDGKPGTVTKLETSRPLKLPDGLRLVSGESFLMVEGNGSLDRVDVHGDKAAIETIKDGLNGPTAVVKVGSTAFVTEGQLPHLFNAKENGPPHLPFITARLKIIAPEIADGRVIIAHLGNGASLCATLGGRSVASTMGFTAVDGLMMGTRCGALDPGVLVHLMDHYGLGPRELEDLIYRRSGFLGVSGISPI